MKKQLKCYIYTRVSTSMQVDGYSLDAQKDKLHKYADYQDMIISGEYSDEGKSGKSVEGRPQFQQMLSDIESGKDNVDYVLVFKLSRFGRNAADVLSSLQRMQDFGVNLICVEDGIDSSKDAGKLMISVLSAVAEIERENILVQTMEGRRQKAREGKWNGGFAPYGYQLINGELHIAEDEAEIIRIIYDKFANTTMGIAAIATFLNNSGYKKKLRQNNTIEGFSTSFVKGVLGVLDNPVYCGKLAFGRRKNEKIPGTRNEYHIVKQDKYMLNDGIHEAIVPEELWNQVHKKRQETGVANIKTHSLDHEHILSGIIKCPICGSGMYGNVNRKKHPGGGHYKDYFYYACKHRTFVNGHKCTYRKQWSEEICPEAIEVKQEEVTVKGEKLVDNYYLFEETIEDDRKETFTDIEKNSIQLSDMYSFMTKTYHRMDTEIPYLSRDIIPLKVADNETNSYREALINILYANLLEKGVQVIVIWRERGEESYYANDFEYTGMVIVDKGTFEIAYYVERGSYDSDGKDAVDGLINEAERLGVHVARLTATERINIEKEIKCIVDRYNNPWSELYEHRKVVYQKWE